MSFKYNWRGVLGTFSFTLYLVKWLLQEKDHVFAEAAAFQSQGTDRAWAGWKSQ